MAREYRVVSADSHLEISPERWTPRVPAKYRDRAPRLVKLADGGDGIVVEGRPTYVLGLAITGRPYAEHSPSGMRYEGAPGAGAPEQRVREQDQDGVDAEVLYTTSGNASFWRGIRDDPTYRAVVHAYNEFLAEEYCAAAPDRLIGMGIMPETGVDDAVGEIEYCSSAGLKGVVLNAFPSGKTYPTAEDDRFWAAAVDLGMAVTAHVGFRPPEGPVFKYAKEPPGVTLRGDPIRVMMRFGGAASSAVQLTMAGVFDRYPRLRIYWAETMIGWLPYALVQVDDIYERSRHWAERLFGIEPLARRPSEYLRDHCWWGFLRDPVGVRVCREYAVNNVMWANDFPHSAGDWPYSSRVIEEIFDGVPEGDRRRMLAGNAVEFFHLS